MIREKMGRVLSQVPPLLRPFLDNQRCGLLWWNLFVGQGDVHPAAPMITLRHQVDHGSGDEAPGGVGVRYVVARYVPVGVRRSPDARVCKVLIDDEEEHSGHEYSRESKYAGARSLFVAPGVDYR